MLLQSASEYRGSPLVAMIDEVKFYFLLGSSWKRCTLSRALARAATRRLAIYGVPFGCAVCDVKFRGLLVTR